MLVNMFCIVTSLVFLNSYVQQLLAILMSVCSISLLFHCVLLYSSPASHYFTTHESGTPLLAHSETQLNCKGPLISAASLRLLCRTSQLQFYVD
jgi:hypothetical protein